MIFRRMRNITIAAVVALKMKTQMIHLKIMRTSAHSQMKQRTIVLMTMSALSQKGISQAREDTFHH